MSKTSSVPAPSKTLALPNMPVQSDTASILAPLAKIKVNESQNPRRKLEPAELDELVEDIKLRGVLEPVLLARDTDDNLTLVAGYRRFAASKKAGLHSIPARVVIETKGKNPESDSASILKAAIAENEKRADLTPLDRCRAAAKLAALGVKSKEIQEIFRRSHSSISHYVRIGQMDPQTLTSLEKVDNPIGAGVYMLKSSPKTREEESEALHKYKIKLLGGGESSGRSGLPDVATKDPKAPGKDDGKKKRAKKGETKKGVTAERIRAVQEYIRESGEWNESAMKDAKEQVKESQAYSSPIELALLVLTLESLLLDKPGKACPTPPCKT